MPKDEINVNFNITSGMGSDHLLTLPFLKTATINDFVGNQTIRDYTPENKTPKFVYKKKILKSEDTLEKIGYNSEEKLAAITVVYVSNRNDMTNYVFINVKPDGSEIIKSIMIDKKIKFDDLKEYIKVGKNGFFVSIDNNDSLDHQLKEILSIERSKIIEMKKYCMESELFSYLHYKAKMKLFMDSF